MSILTCGELQEDIADAADPLPTNRPGETVLPPLETVPIPRLVGSSSGPVAADSTALCFTPDPIPVDLGLVPAQVWECLHECTGIPWLRHHTLGGSPRFHFSAQRAEYIVFGSGTQWDGQILVLNCAALNRLRDRWENRPRFTLGGNTRFPDPFGKGAFEPNAVIRDVFGEAQEPEEEEGEPQETDQEMRTREIDNELVRQELEGFFGFGGLEGLTGVVGFGSVGISF